MIKRLLGIIALTLCVAISFGQSTAKNSGSTDPADATAPKELNSPSPQQVDSPLVRAAKASRANKKKTTSRVIINNDDVKNSKGKLIYITEKPIEKIPTTEAVRPLPDDGRGPVVNPLVAATQRLDAAKKEVADLEKELARLEEDYYNEDDANYRDSVIESRFVQAKKQLETARQKLLDAREAHREIEQKQASRPTP